MLAARGLDVLVTDVDSASALETADQIGGRAWAMGHDVRDPDAHRGIAAAAVERGPLEVWVNSAGILRTHPDSRKDPMHCNDNFRLPRGRDDAGVRRVIGHSQ